MFQNEPRILSNTMHELSLCGAIADIVDRRSAGRPVAAVHVQIGQLRQVVPEALEFCWSMVVAGTPLEGSMLDLQLVSARLKCRSCGAERDLGTDFAFACLDCGGLDMGVLRGEEFVVTALDLAEV